MREELLILLENFGEALSSDPVVTGYAEARELLTSDAEAMSLTREYNVQTMMLKSMQQASEPDKLAIRTTQEKMEELKKKMDSNETLIKFNIAENALNDLINEINGKLTAYITPAGGCSGSCSTCGGCG
ncbi:MAG: YlbF family regulator [Clostridia bacterium]|nr:YlbF family regulator [Clostridia bacterium]